MEISIIRNNRFNRIEIEHNGEKISLGEIGRKESLELAKDLIFAAQELLPAEHEVFDIADRVLAAVRSTI